MSARVRIALILAGLALAVTAIAYLVVVPMVARRSLGGLESQLVRQRKLFQSNKRIEAVDAVTLVEKYAGEPTFVNVLRANDAAKGFEEIEVHNVRLQERGRKADFFALIDGQGKLLVRDVDPQSMRGEDLKGKYPGAAAALAGEANRDVWLLRGALYRVAVAPVRDAGNVIGAIAVGFVVGTTDAKADADLLGSEVLYYLDKRIFAASLEDQDKTKEFEKSLGTTNPLVQAILAGKETTPFRVNLKGENFRGIAMTMPAVKNRQALVFLLTSERRALSGMGMVKGGIVLGGLVMVLLVLAGWLTISRHFMKPLEQLELTTSEIINGKLEAEYRVFTDEYEGLANALNVMVSKLTGRPEPGSVDESWAGDPLFIEDLDITTQSVMAAMGPDGQPMPATGLEQTAAELAREPEASYYARIYKEYVEARRRLGQDSMAFERFVEKTRQNEQALCQKYRCRMVRFQVMVRPNQVTLKPVPIDPIA